MMENGTTKVILRTENLEGCDGYLYHTTEAVSRRTAERLFAHLRTAMDLWLTAARCPECGHPVAGCRKATP
jgi:hypothetical protein